MNREIEKEIEITVDNIEEKIKEGYKLIDMRDFSKVAYGIIPGAIVVESEKLEEHSDEFKQYTGVIIYCTRGQYSLDAAEKLQDSGVNALSLRGGFNSWLMAQMELEKDTNKQHDIEQGIQKAWHKKLFTPFAKAVKKYEMIQEGDKIAVCISGGKDSMLMAKLFQEIQRHRLVNFQLTFIVMDPGYSSENRKVIEHNAKMLGIPIKIFESNIFDIVYDEEKSPCYLCARMRRGYLYSKAKELGCNKIALGHHYDDVIETILMGMLYGAQIQTMMPKLHSTNFKNMELIRPMYLIREDDIKRWRDENNLKFIQCACHFTDTCTTCAPDGRTVSKRMEIKNLIKELKEVNPYVEGNIFKSMENVNLDTVIQYKQDGKKYSFLDKYNLE